MTLEEARKIIKEIHEKYHILFSECREERGNGKVKFLDCTLSFLIDDSATLEDMGDAYEQRRRLKRRTGKYAESRKNYPPEEGPM